MKFKRKKKEEEMSVNFTSPLAACNLNSFSTLFPLLHHLFVLDSTFTIVPFSISEHAQLGLGGLKITVLLSLTMIL